MIRHRARKRDKKRMLFNQMYAANACQSRGNLPPTTFPTISDVSSIQEKLHVDTIMEHRTREKEQ